MRKVGKNYGEEKKLFTYKDVKNDEGGWADCNRFLPLTFDLVYLKFENTTKIGWYTGSCWDGVQIKPIDNPKYWKRQGE